PEVVISVVENDLHVPILHQRPKLWQRARVQRIDYGTMMLRGELQQIYPIHVAMEARPFGVDSNFADLRDRVDEESGFFCGVQINWLVRICHTSIYHDLRAIPASPTASCRLAYPRRSASGNCRPARGCRRLGDLPRPQSHLR